jgi:hypothetical protein
MAYLGGLLLAVALSTPSAVTLAEPLEIATGRSSLAMATGDLDGDGDTDAVTLVSGRPVVLRNEAGTLTAGPPVGTLTVDGHALEVVDMNGDGRPDIVAGGVGRVIVFPGRGDTTFGPPLVTVTNHELAFDIATADLDRDGDRDVIVPVVRTGRAVLLRNNGAGGLSGPTMAHLGGSTTPDANKPVAVTTADLNRDGRTDLVVGHQLLGTTVLLGAESATGLGVPTVVSSVAANDVSVGDIDGDGWLDIVSVRRGVIATMNGRGDGTFAPPSVTTIASGLHDYAATVDLDGDQRDEVVVAGGAGSTTASGALAVLRGGAVVATSALRWRGAMVASADIDGDGRADLLVGNDATTASSIAYLRNLTIPSNTAPSVAIEGVADAVTYEIGTEPVVASCVVTDAEDGPSTHGATFDATGLDAHGLGSVVVACDHTDAGGLTAHATAAFSVVDTIGPAITWSGETGYVVGDQLSLACTASDMGTGVASTTCDTASGVALLDVGTFTITASATDHAGNATTSTNTYTVGVTFDALADLTRSYASDGGDGLIAKLDAAAAAAARGQHNVVDNVLRAYRNAVRAQSGKSLTSAEAATLTELSLEL